MSGTSRPTLGRKVFAQAQVCLEVPNILLPDIGDQPILLKRIQEIRRNLETFSWISLGKLTVWVRLGGRHDSVRAKRGRANFGFGALQNGKKGKTGIPDLDP